VDREDAGYDLGYLQLISLQGEIAANAAGEELTGMLCSQLCFVCTE